MKYLDLIESGIHDYDKMSGLTSTVYHTQSTFSDKALTKYNSLAKEIMETLRTDCQPWFKMAEGSAGYRGMKLNSASNYNNELFLQKSVRSNRKSADSPQELTDAIDDALNELGYRFIHRGNSLFIIGDKGEAISYGRVFRIFPIGEFQYVWNPHMRDPWSDYDDHKFHDYSEKLKKELRLDIMNDMKLQYKNHIEKWKNVPFGHPEYGVQELSFDAWLDEELNGDSFDDAVEFELEKQGKTFDPIIFWETAGKFYTNEDLKSGLESGHEIMIRVDSYYAVYNDFYDKFIGEF